MTNRPEIGDTVVYTSKIDNGPGNEVLSPAVVLRTRATTVAAVANRWGPARESPVDGKTHTTADRPDSFVEELPDDYTVDLLVHGLGRDYREYAVKYSPYGEHKLGVWRWGQ